MCIRVCVYVRECVCAQFIKREINLCVIQLPEAYMSTIPTNLSKGLVPWMYNTINMF